MAGNEDLDLLEFFPMGRNRHEGPKAFLVEDDGTLRAWSIGVGVDANARERPILVEAGRQGATVLWGEGPAGLERVAVQDFGGGAGTPHGLINVPVGWDGATFPIFRVENVASGEAGAQKISLYGTDEAGNVDAHRTDPNRIPWKRPYDGYLQVDPVVMTAAVIPLWTPGTTAAHLYAIEFKIVNNDLGAAAVTVSIGVDIGAAGTLNFGEYWLFNHVIPYPGSTVWEGPFIMPGDDRVMGIASAADDTSVQWRIRRLDLGA